MFNSRFNNEARLRLWASISTMACILLYYIYLIYRTDVVGAIAVACGVQCILFIIVIKALQWRLPNKELFVGRIWLVVVYATVWGCLYV